MTGCTAFALIRNRAAILMYKEKQVGDTKFKIQVIRSGRRTICIEITPECDVIVRAPYLTTRKEIERFIDSKSDWINKHFIKALKRKAESDRIGSEGRRPYSDDEIRKLVIKAKAIIPPKVEHYAGILNAEYGRITSRNQKTRWGSCSAKKNLNFNCYLMNAPEKVLDYVIIHEVCHLIHMDHSKEFWTLVGDMMPDYKMYRRWLKDNGESLMYVSDPN